MSMKQPVPYVFFASPGVKHVCPKSADCWSPAAPEIVIAPPKRSAVVSPYTQLEGLTSGSMQAGMPSSASISSSHLRSMILYSIVREALE